MGQKLEPTIQLGGRDAGDCLGSLVAGRQLRSCTVQSGIVTESERQSWESPSTQAAIRCADPEEY
jgi:hypothetical protein